MLGVVKLGVPLPPDKTNPPAGAAYQSIVRPAPGSSTEIVTDPLPQRELPCGFAGADGESLNVTFLQPDAQVATPHTGVPEGVTCTA